MTAQKLLEGDKYVAVCLFVSYISDFRDGLNHALDDLKLPVPADDSGGECGKESGDSVHGCTCQRFVQTLGGWQRRPYLQRVFAFLSTVQVHPNVAMSNIGVDGL